MADLIALTDPAHPTSFGQKGASKRRKRASSRATAVRLLQVFLNGRNPRTARAYRSDLQNLRAFLGLESLVDVVQHLLDASHGELNMTVLRYRAQLIGLGLAPATANRRLATVRSLLKRARVLGLTPWTIEVGNLKVEAYRDTRGPGRKGFDQMLKILEPIKTPKGLRDYAAVRLLFDLALRRQEVVNLDLADLDLLGGTLLVLGKGRTQKVKLTLPAETQKALAAWVAIRGDHQGPLFTNFDRARKGYRLTGRSLYRVVHSVGKQAGIRVTPHGLRHAAITEALDLTKGDVRAVQRFSRHRDLRVLNVYDDSRADLAGMVAKLVASGKSRGRKSAKAPMD